MPKEKRTIKKTDRLFQPFMKVYFDWFENHIGIKPKIDGADGKALKYIIKYFRSIAEDELEILKAWETIFSNYDKWDKFYQKQLNLRHINSNLMNIINSIKNGKQGITEGQSIAEMRNAIGNIDE